MDVAKVHGETVLIDGMGGKTRTAVTVNGANVTNADILASNGVIQVIDKGLLYLRLASECMTKARRCDATGLFSAYPDVSFSG